MWKSQCGNQRKALDEESFKNLVQRREQLTGPFEGTKSRTIDSCVTEQRRRVRRSSKQRALITKNVYSSVLSRPTLSLSLSLDVSPICSPRLARWQSLGGSFLAEPDKPLYSLNPLQEGCFIVRGSWMCFQEFKVLRNVLAKPSKIMIWRVHICTCMYINVFHKLRGENN